MRTEQMDMSLRVVLSKLLGFQPIAAFDSLKPKPCLKTWAGFRVSGVAISFFQCKARVVGRW